MTSDTSASPHSLHGDPTGVPGPDVSSRPSDHPAGSALPRILVVLLVAAASWLVVTGLKELQDIVGPLLLTLNLLIVAYPIQARLARRGVPKIIGAIITGIIVFAILLVFFSALGWSLTLLVQEIPSYQDRFTALYRQAVELAGRFGMSEGQLLEQVQQVSPSNLAGPLSTALGSVTGAVGLLVVTVTIIFVTLIDSMQFPMMMRTARHRHADVVQALSDFGVGVRRYWVVSSVFGLIVAALDVAALMFMGVPLALVWGVLSFLTNYIPNIGFVLGIVPPTLMALLANGPVTALLVVVAYSVINFVIQSIIQPKFNGDAIGVNATVSLLSLLFWAWVLGPLGALLALPATLLCKTLLIDIDPSVRWVNAFLAADPATAEPDIDDVLADSSEPTSGAHAVKPKDRAPLDTDGTVVEDRRPPAEDATAGESSV